MLPWWGWVALWAVLVVGGGLWVAARARATWHSARALSAEVSRAGAIVAELEMRADSLGDAAAEPPPTAVTQDPSRVREEYRRLRAGSAAARRARRLDRRPPWARVD
jgi:hypothetical protein